MATFAQLKNNISLELGLDTTVAGNEDTLLGRRLNQAVRQVLIDTHCRVSVSTTALTPDEGDYELPTDVLAVNQLINEDSKPLDRVSDLEIHELRRGTNPTDIRTRKYAVDGANLLMVYPTPSEAETLTMYYVKKPTEMTADANDPSSATYGGIPVEYHDAIEYYTLYRMASYDDDQSSGMGALYKQQYDAEVKRIRAAIRRRGGKRLGPARIGRPGFKRVPSHPSQDTYYR